MNELLEPALEELLDSSEPEQVLEVVVRIKNANDVPNDIQVISQFGDVITCRIPSNKIREIKKLKSILSIRAPRPLMISRPLIEHLPLEVNTDQEKYDLPEAVNDQFRRPRELTGMGVAMAFIDEGIDFTSKAFLDKDGNTRFKAIWFQNAKYLSDRPNKYGYGRIYTREEINQSLNEKDPFYALGYDPSTCQHGTAVCDIAAGSRRISDKGQIQGIAPGSDLICVVIGSQNIRGLYNLGDSLRLLEALDFVSNIAGDMPLVVNISLGNTGGPHDPTTNVVKGIDNFVSQSSSKLVFMSTGNYKDAQIHTNGIVRPGREKTFNWLIDPNDVTYNELEIWYSGSNILFFGISMPGSSEVLTTRLGEKKPILVNGIKVGMAYHRKDTLNHDCVIDVFLYKEAPAGKWKIILYGTDVVDGRYHAWIERDSGNPNNQSRFDRNDATIYSTIGSICNGLYSIAVGAFDIRSKERKLAPFSSCGPTRIGTRKPDLIAPGVQIPVANCSAPKALPPKSDFILGSGTSFATPFVSGTVALMFQACNGELTSSEIRKILLSTAEKSLEDSYCLGEGYLNIDASLRAVVDIVARKGIKLKEGKDPEEAFIEYFNHREDSEDTSPIRIPENVNIAEPTENILINQGSSNHYELGSLGGDEDVLPEEKVYGYETIDKNLTSSDNSISVDSDIYNMQDQGQDQNQYYTDNSLSRYKIIEIVNDYILSNSGGLSAESLVTHVLTKAGAMDGQNLWFHRYLTPPIIFDFFKYGKNPYALNFDDIFEVVARPGERFIGKFDCGDMIFRKILGTKYGYLWFIVSPELFTYEELSRNNLTAERGNKAAKYVHIVEGGRLHHPLENSFCRVALDEFGRVPENQVALRLKNWSVTKNALTIEETDKGFDDIIHSKFWPLTESPPKLNLEECKKNWLKFRDIFPEDVREALNEGNVSAAITIAIHHGIRDRAKLIKLGYLAKHGEERGYCYPILPNDVVAKGEHQWMEVEVKSLLSRPSPPLAQKGPIKCLRREKIKDKAHPDEVGFDITGRYERRYTPKSSDPTNKLSRITEFILHINQAGKHIEGFVTIVLRPKSTQQHRYSTRFYADLQDDGRFLFFSRERPDLWWGYLSYEIGQQKGQLYLQTMEPAGPKVPLWKVSELPTVMDWDWLDSPHSEIIFHHERFPLTLDQLNHLVKSFQEETISPLLQVYFSTPADDTVSGRIALDKASRKLDNYISKAFTQDDFGIHELDLILAGYYVRMILSQNKWTFKQQTMSQLDWIQIMLDVLTQLGSGLPSATKYLGLKPTVKRGGKPVDPTIPPNKYKISLKLRGAAIHFRGEITINKVSEPRWTKPETFKISLWGLQVKPGFTIDEDGEAETYSDWKPSDIPGKVVFLTSAIGGNLRGVKVRAGAWILQIFGSEIYPYMDVHGKDLDVGVSGGKKSKLDLVNLGGLWGDIYEKKLPDKDYSKFTPVIDYSTTYGLKEDVHFCRDSAILTADGRQALRIICANYLPAFMNPDSTLEIAGHADTLASRKYNYELSKFRAENTKQAIIDILGDKFLIKKVNAWGEGEMQAAIVDPNQTPNPQYRRVDISLNSRLIISLRSA